MRRARWLIHRYLLMRILFDHGTPAPLIQFLEGHAVTKAKDMGWDRISNGALLAAAEEAGFEVLLTTDKQSNISRICRIESSP